MKRHFSSLAGVVIFSALALVLQNPEGEITWVNEAHAAGGKVTSPTGIAPDRYVYYPGTEALAKDEIRLFACGTGLPAARCSQAATCWLVELGNGDKFLFDIGTGSMVNVAALMIPYDFLNKVFLISSVKLATYAPDVHIQIPRSACKAYEFDRAAELIELGHAMAGEAIGNSVAGT